MGIISLVPMNLKRPNSTKTLSVSRSSCFVLHILSLYEVRYISPFIFFFCCKKIYIYLYSKFNIFLSCHWQPTIRYHSFRRVLIQHHHPIASQLSFSLHKMATLLSKCAQCPIFITNLKFTSDFMEWMSFINSLNRFKPHRYNGP